MKYDFRVRSDEICTEEGERITVYGVDVISEGAAVKTLKDIFCNRNDAEAFVRFCSDGAIPPEELENAAADAVDKLGCCSAPFI